VLPNKARVPSPNFKVPRRAYAQRARDHQLFRLTPLRTHRFALLHFPYRCIAMEWADMVGSKWMQWVRVREAEEAAATEALNRRTKQVGPARAGVPKRLWPHALRAAAQAGGGPFSALAIGMAVMNEELPMVRVARSTWIPDADESLHIVFMRMQPCEAGVPPDFPWLPPSLWSAANLPIMEWACGDVGGSNGSTPLGGSRSISMIENWRRLHPLWARLLQLHRPYCLKIDSDTLIYPVNIASWLYRLPQAAKLYVGTTLNSLWLKPEVADQWLDSATPPLPIAQWRAAGWVPRNLSRTRERSRRAAATSNIAGSSSSSSWAFAQGSFELVSRDAVRMLVESRCLLAMGQTELVRGGEQLPNRATPPHGRGRAFWTKLNRFEDAALGFCLWLFGVPLTPANAIFPREVDIHIPSDAPEPGRRKKTEKKTHQADLPKKSIKWWQQPQNSWDEEGCRSKEAPPDRCDRGNLFRCHSVIAVHGLKTAVAHRRWWSKCRAHMQARLASARPYDELEPEIVF